MQTYTLTLNSEHASVNVDDYGDDQPVLLLHGGAGPASVTAFAQHLAASRPAQVYVPTHPGFAGTPRPEWLESVAGLAELYVALLEHLGLEQVTVVGNSIGGWIAAEMALRQSARISGVVLVDAVGIEVEGHPVADFFSLSMAEVAARSYYNPAAFRMDLSNLSDEQKRLMASSRQALALYGGKAMTDPTLAARLGEVSVPTSVIWGEYDRIGDPEYGRAYADAVPNATFNLLERTGHLPQLESPDQLLATLWPFVESSALTKV